MVLVQPLAGVAGKHPRAKHGTSQMRLGRFGQTGAIHGTSQVRGVTEFYNKNKDEGEGVSNRRSADFDMVFEYIMRTLLLNIGMNGKIVS